MIPQHATQFRRRVPALRVLDISTYASQFTTFITPAAGSTFQDSSGNTQPSWCSSAWTVRNAPVHSATGWVCTNDWWRSSGNPGADLDGTTIFVAFTVDSASANEGLLGVRSSTNTSTQGWDVRRTTPNTVIAAGDGTSNSSELNAYTDATFASIAVTFDQAGNDEILTYMNGASTDPIDLSALGDIFLTGTPLDVGGVANTVGLNGTLHGFVFNDTPLSASAILGLHQHFAGVAGA